MYTWVIVINKKGEQKSPTQTETKKKTARKTQRKLFLQRTRDTGQHIFLPSNTREELLC